MAQISHPGDGLQWPHHVAKMIIVLLSNSCVPPSSIVATISNTVLTLLPNCTIVAGILKDGYVRNVPLPRVPRIQSAKLIAPSRCIPEGTTTSRDVFPLPDYLPVSKWIPMLPKLGSLLGCSQRVL